jgi:leucyl aminopeptidase
MFKAVPVKVRAPVEGFAKLCGVHPTLIASSTTADSVPLWLATEASYGSLRQQLLPEQSAWLLAQGFAAERYRVQSLPRADGHIAGAVVGLGCLATADALSLWDAAAMQERLPAGTYRLATPLTPQTATQLVLGWILGSYRFTRLRSSVKGPKIGSKLVLPTEADAQYAEATAGVLGWARDLINAPANELGPEQLTAAACELARAHGGAVEVCQGAELRAQYPLIDAVGAASARSPRLIDCQWLRPGGARVTLVGKGVCFDSGGLDLKPSAAMLLMKKDMGGAACALALARLLLEMQAPVQLRLLIPAVDNSVGGRAFRPGDVWRSRKGLTVEIGNTDAEGRLVLADALTAADADKPDLLIDLATLTGAARTALGPDLPAAFSTDEVLLEQLRAAGTEHHDPLWPLPLWAPYEEELASRIADLNNVASTAFAGAVIGALFLKRFVTATPAWIHLDLYAWNAKDRPGRPLGAEAHCVRALYQLIRRRFG